MKNKGRSQRRNKKLKALYDARYRLFYHNPSHRFICFYCGRFDRITFEHQPALSRISDYESLNLKHEDYIKIPSCFECNRLASDQLHESLFERKMYVNEKLLIKYKWALRAGEWSHDELEDMGPNLKEYIATAESIRTWIDARLNYTDGVQAYADDIDDRF